MHWQVSFKKKAQKQLDDLPKPIFESVIALTLEMERLGPLRYNWKNFGKLKGTENRYHCHVKDGKPTYVVC